MKQNKISSLLKGIDILLVIVVICIVALLTWWKLNPQLIGGNLIAEAILSLPILYALTVIAFFILLEFWHVCTEIGKDNSFSEENAASFHNMMFAGLAAEAMLIMKLIHIFAKQGHMMLPILWTIVEMVIMMIFMVLCECLSKLIQNAYEMKSENDLTI